MQGGGSDSWLRSSAAVNAAFYSSIAIPDNAFVLAGDFLHIPRIHGRESGRLEQRGVSRRHHRSVGCRDRRDVAIRSNPS